MLPLILFFLLFTSANAQFAEIASIATSLLGSGLGPALGGAASAGSAAVPALSQIGQLYQLAQGALQLTGTGVGVLNQASEGNWFPAVLEQASKNARGFMGPNGAGGLGGMPNLGALGPRPLGSTGSQIGPEFGTGFPAPNVEDYTDGEEDKDKTTTKSPDGLVSIDEVDELTSTAPPTIASTPTIPVTLFPDESNSVTEASTLAPLKEIRIELPKSTGPSTDTDYIDQVTTDGDSRVQVTNKAKSDGDENLLMPDRASAAKTLNAKIRTGVPDLTRLIDVLRKSNLKEAEIMEIVSQVEGNDNAAPPPRIDFTSAVQNIPLKKHLNRERIVKASRELHRNIEPHERAIEAHLNNIRQIPDLAATATPSPVAVTASPNVLNPVAQVQSPQPGFLATNRLQREISSVPVEKAPYPQSTLPPNNGLLLHQAQFTTPPNYLLPHHWHHPHFPQPQFATQPHLLQPQPAVHPLFQQQYQQLPYQQPYRLQQPYSQQSQGVQQPQQIAQPGAGQQQIQNAQHTLQQQQPQQQQQQQHQQQQPYYQHHQTYQQQYQQQQVRPQQQYQQPQATHYQGTQPYPQQSLQYSTQQQVVPPQQQQYRQFRQINGQAYGTQARPAVFTNQPPGAPPQYNRASHIALSAPTRHGNDVTKGKGSAQIVQRSVQQVASSSTLGKTRGVGYSSQRLERDPRSPAARGLRSPTLARSAHVVSSSIRTGRQVTIYPPRRYPARTARTQPITTPAPVRVADEANQPLL